MQLRTLILSLAITASALPLASVDSAEGEVQSINIARDTDSEVQSPQSVDIARRANSASVDSGEGEVQSINIARDTDGEVHSPQSVDIARRADNVHATESAEPDSVDIA